MKSGLHILNHRFSQNARAEFPGAADQVPARASQDAPHVSKSIFAFNLSTFTRPQQFMDYVALSMVGCGILIFGSAYVIVAKWQDREISEMPANAAHLSLDEPRRSAIAYLAKTHWHKEELTYELPAWNALPHTVREFFDTFGAISFDFGDALGQPKIAFVVGTPFKKRIKKCMKKGVKLENAIVIGSDFDGDIFVCTPDTDVVYMITVCSTLDRYESIYHLVPEILLGEP